MCLCSQIDWHLSFEHGEMTLCVYIYIYEYPHTIHPPPTHKAKPEYTGL